MPDADQTLTNHAFFDLCYDRYRRAEDQVEAIYRRGTALLLVILVLAVFTYALCPPDAMLAGATRAVRIAYLVASVAALAALAVALGALGLCMLPRSYESLPPMQWWADWGKDYRRRFAEAKQDPDEHLIAATRLALLTEKLVCAQEDHYRINELRRRHFHTTVVWTALAAGVIVLQAILRIALQIARV